MNFTHDRAIYVNEEQKVLTFTGKKGHYH